MKKLLLIAFCLSQLSCSFFDSFDEAPMFLNFNSASLITTSDQGENTHKIRDIEVFADGFSVGVFNLPAVVPVLQTNDSVDINIFAVIRNNNIAPNPIEYPFYASQDYTLAFKENQTIDLDLNFRYRSDAIIEQVCDFETFNCFTNNIDNNSDIVFTSSSLTDFGDFCGQITIPEANKFFEKSTFSSIKTSGINSNLVFLEMDYHNDIDFGIGVVLEGSGLPNFQAYKVVLTPQENWNKAYIEISEFVSGANVERFKVLYGITTSTSQPGSVWVDNIRILHF